MASIQPSKTITFKTVGSLEIPLDLYLPKNAKAVPVLLWFHGGGLLMGRRTLLAPHMRHAVEKYKLAVISADYRLAPQVGVADIWEDVRDCIAFIQQKLPQHAGEGVLDTSRVAVSGSSAGGYLALLAGLYAEPRPKVLLPIYPITDPLGTFFTNSQPAPKGRYAADAKEMAPYLDESAPAIANCGPVSEDPRSHMYVFMLRSANLAQLLHVPSGKEGDKFRISRNVYEQRRTMPPSYFLHGDEDSAVGVEQSDEVVGAMAGCGVEVKYERPHGGDHFLDIGEDYENEAMYNFLMKHL